MIKKLVVLAATALFSLNASAGYIQYNFSTGSSGGLDGYIVQHDTDQSIAHFSFWLTHSTDEHGYGQVFQPQDSEGKVLLTSASTYFRENGPTNFKIFDNFGADHETWLSVDFARSTGGNFTYTAQYWANLFPNLPPMMYSGMVSGLATRGTVDPGLASYLDSRGGYEFAVPRIVPAYIGPSEVPEPTSLALLALGAAGLAGASRRRKAAQQ